MTLVSKDSAFARTLYANIECINLSL